MQFMLPRSLAEWLPFAAAVLTALYGLAVLFSPRIAFRTIGRKDKVFHARALASGRGDIGGFHLGMGLIALAMFDQPFLQLALGAGWLGAAVGRLVSIVMDRSGTLSTWAWFLFSLALAGMTLAPPLGYLPG
ncbi:DUF4345 domain-containing protein [Consotaella aegiceratis]|uniref:AGROH133_08824 family phage infection protein n=1 Tax=Consotaella aegiceratis TaxID=3097961 RepID=UPI002F42C1B8